MLCDLDAVALRRMIDAGEITVRALLESCIERIELANPATNAVVATCYSEARTEADRKDRQTANGGELPLLHGLPVLIKDLIETKGLHTTYGSLCFESYIPDEDAEIVARLKQAGAIVLGKTNTPEFGAGATTYNKVYGATGNPFNPTLTCGGSSGGSAVAVATGMAPLAIGSDFGGSLRIPASFCSIVSLRPTIGLVPSTLQVLSNSPLWTEGPMARTVADAALCLSAISGYSTSDMRSWPTTSNQRQSIDLSKLAVGFSVDHGIATIDDEIRTLFEKRASFIGKCFSEVKGVALNFREATEIFRIARVKDVFANCAHLEVKFAERLGENIRANLNDAEQLSLADVANAEAAHSRLFRRFQKTFEDVDILISPATAVSPFSLDAAFPHEINGKQLDGYFSWYAVTWALSLTGCPIITIPCGMDHNDMPFGIQIIGSRHSDKFVIEVAKALETCLNANKIGQYRPASSGA